MDREKLIELVRQSGYGYFITHENANVEECLANTADYIIANGIGDIAAEKHRADVAEEALSLAFDEWTCCDSCMFSVDCKTNREDCKKAQISKIKQQAEARLKELENNND